MSVNITKSDGETEPFDIRKLVHSLLHAGATEIAAEAIARDVEKELWNGISTQEIYARAFKRLREHKKGVAARYSLKRSVMEFGPSGFPFEAYLSELFRAEGFKTEIDQIVQGACVEHEVDVVIHKPGEITYAEAKFHNTVGFKTDLKTVLYVSARIMDIREMHKNSTKREERITVSGLVVTNTKFTDKALQYSQCQGLELLGWDNPGGSTLHERIEKHALYPVTALTSLSSREKMALLSRKVVLCRTLPEQGAALREAGITGKRADEVLSEVGSLCYPEKDIQ
ncbi:MAG TPA: ATP cone domain-containing protein [Candidatus Paceibacterota bacterium]|nr:ATP cone domain-containing protein [Candidatus Paceibacterota bacterium]